MASSSNSSSGLGDDLAYERVLLVKPTVYIYKIPPISSVSRGFRAMDWNLGEPSWTGRLRVISKGDELFLYIEDASTGMLYAKAPVLAFPGAQVQPVEDSSRYFVVKVVNDVDKRSALLGVGFADGSDAFDLNVALREHFSYLTNNANSLDNKDDTEHKKLDLSLKNDIRVNIDIFKGGSKRIANQSEQDKVSPRKERNEAAASDSSCPILLPPPPQSSRSRKK